MRALTESKLQNVSFFVTLSLNFTLTLMHIVKLNKSTLIVKAMHV